MNTPVDIDPYVEGLVKATSAKSVELIMNVKNGFFMDPQLDIGGTKTLRKYCAQERAKKLTDCLRSYTIRATHKVHPGEATDRRATGTYYHPALLLNYAEWVSPEAYAHSANIVAQVLAADEFDRLRRAKLWRCGEVRSCVKLSREPPVWRWRCDKLTLLADERGWLDGEELCAQFGRRLTVDEFASRTTIAPLAEYLRRRGLLERRYCHPLLALRLAAYVDADCYLKCARLVFCHGRQPLNRLFRLQFEVAAAEPGKWVDGGIAPAARDRPSTSGQTAAWPTGAWLKMEPSFSSTLSSSSSSSDESRKADRGQTLAACRKMWDQERRSLQKDVERERAAKNAALAQVGEMQAQVRELRTKLRSKEEAHDKMLQRLDDLRARLSS